MRYLHEAMDEVLSLLKEREKIFLALDYDGTIVPISKSPREAVLPQKTKDVIMRLIKRPRISLVIVTGRQMEDIKGIVGIEEIDYIANHGFEMLCGGRYWVHPKVKEYSVVLEEFLDYFKEVVGGIDGLLIEKKRYTLSLHYRNIKEGSLERVRKGVFDSISRYKGLLSLNTGKRVFEIRPDLKWDKGKAVLRLIGLIYKESEPLRIYMGDDRTDEDVFRILKDEDISIFVGQGLDAGARYFVRDVNEVIEFLRMLGGM
jgi:trehalose-phosphatase